MMTGIEMIEKQSLNEPHVLIAVTNDAAVVVPLMKVLEAMNEFNSEDKQIALLPCVMLASDGVLVREHLVHFLPGMVCWFEVPGAGRIRSMLGTITKDAERTLSAFMRCYFVAKGDVLVVAKTEHGYKTALQAITL